MGNRWLRPGAGHMGDGDKMKVTQAAHQPVPNENHLRQACGRPQSSSLQAVRPEGGDSFHILQECTFVQAPRSSRHNYIESQIIAKLRKHHPSATVLSKRLITDRDGVRLRPNIVLDLPERGIRFGCSRCLGREHWFPRAREHRQVNQVCLTHFCTWSQARLGLGFDFRRPRARVCWNEEGCQGNRINGRGYWLACSPHNGGQSQLPQPLCKIDNRLCGG